MKKIILSLAVMMVSASSVLAETSEFDISTAGTEQGMLERKETLLPAPKEKDGSDKDVAYWAQSVLSRVKVLGYAQAGYTATLQDKGDNSNTFDMKRVVMMLGADIAPGFYAFIMHEFKAGNLLEYYMEYRPSKAVNFRLGQYKTELSIANPLSPRIFESINCSPLAVGWLCGSDPLMSNGSGRDLGLTMYGNLFNNHLYYAVQLMNGGQINKSDRNNQKNVIAKLEYKPAKTLRLSVSGQKGYGNAVAASVYNRNIAVGETYRSDRYAVGFEWMSSLRGNDYFKNRCTVVRCEALGGRDGNCHSFGAYGSLTQPVYKGLDIVAQVDYLNRNTDLKYKQTDLLFGVQYWMHTKCRIQAQYNHSILSNEMKLVSGHPGNYGNFMTQVQFSF